MPAPIPAATYEQARADYIAGLGTVAEIAERHGMSEHTLRARANGQGWVRAREDFILAQRGLRESKGAISGIVPREPRVPISGDYFLVHGERLYQQVATLGDQVEDIDLSLASIDKVALSDVYIGLMRLKLAILAEWKDLQGIARIAPRKVREKAVSARSFATPIDSPTDNDTKQPTNQESGDLTEQHMPEPTPADLP